MSLIALIGHLLNTEFRLWLRLEDKNTPINHNNDTFDMQYILIANDHAIDRRKELNVSL